MTNRTGRFMRVLPGRVRIEVFGLKSNEFAAKIITSQLNIEKGIQSFTPCTATGRVLITFQQNIIQLDRIVSLICEIEQYLCSAHHSREQLHNTVPFDTDCSFKEVAATGENTSFPNHEEDLSEFYRILSGVPALTELSTVYKTRKDLNVSALNSVVSVPKSIPRTRTNKPKLTGPISTDKILFNNYYSMKQNDVLNTFSVNEKTGLTETQVANLKVQYGVNQLQPQKPTPWLSSYLEQFKEFPTLVILGAAVLSLASGHFYDGLAMGCVLLANAGVGTLQEHKAKKAIEALNQYQPPKCKVLRNSSIVVLNGTDLVPGDIVHLEAGDRVPADIRLLHSFNLEVNESALTGESVAVQKQAGVVENSTPLAERKNMLYMGMDVTRGKGVGVVVNTGMNTEMGSLMSLIKEQKSVLTPLHHDVTIISKKFFKWAVFAGGLVLISGIIRGIPITQMISTSIILAASAIPEGLPVMITIALSAGVFRMSKKNALIRKMSALETLGRITVICTDKTGTLTKNEMTVKKITSVTSSWTVTGNGYDPAGQIIPVVAHAAISNKTNQLIQTDFLEQPELGMISRIGLLCNNSELYHEGEYWKIKGDPTEGALLSMAAKSGLWLENMKNWHRAKEIPFDSNSGTMQVVYKDIEQETNNSCYVFVKGSVESILKQCRWYQKNGALQSLNIKIREKILKQNEELAGQALRVLGFAYSRLESEDEVLDDKNLVYVGMVGMMDPPKPDVEKSIQEAYFLGVKPVMITGDHANTAKSIANELGIGKGNPTVVTGKELDQLSDLELTQIIEKVTIFARVTPEHKLRIVKAYQALGHIVAMTGDGVNDTPAINQSNIGIAMGGTGTEVTKASADMVLIRDHFGSIIEGVKEGRTLIGNIRKAIGCLLTCNLAEILVTASAVIVGLPIPLVPLQILLINLIADAIPAMILAANPLQNSDETKIVKRQEIVDGELYRKVISGGLVLAAGSLGLFAATLATGASLAVAQTIAFSSLVIGHYIQTISWRREGCEETIPHWTKDKYLLGGLGASLCALLAAIYVAPFTRIFGTAPLSAHHWLNKVMALSVASISFKPILALSSSRRKDTGYTSLFTNRVLPNHQLATANG